MNQGASTSRMTSDDALNLRSPSHMTSDQVMLCSPRKTILRKPQFLKPFERSITNSRAGKSFFLAFLAPKLDLVRLFFAGKSLMRSHYGTYQDAENREVGFAVVQLNDCLRDNEIRSELESRSYIVNSPLIVECLKDCGNLFKFLKCNPGVNDRTDYEMYTKVPFNYEKFTDYALKRDIRNPMTLTFEYSEIAKNCESDVREKFPDHFENALTFVAMPDRHRHSQAAVKVVMSYATERVAKISNADHLKSVLKDIFDWWDGPECPTHVMKDYVALAEMMRRLHGECKLKLFFESCLESFRRGEIKKRWVALSGDYDSGKSTIANGLKSLFGGVAININLADETRRTFQLGMAIGQRYVLFDDVRKRGIDNLDNSMRDYLDGHHEVVLERKNRDPVQQVFPPGCITTNEDSFPESLLKRIRIFKFFNNSTLVERHEAIFYNARFDNVAVAVLCQILGIQLEGVPSTFVDSVRILHSSFREKHRRECVDCGAFL